MADIFLKKNLQEIFRGKSILFLGDSIMRNIYKDFVWLTGETNYHGEYIPSRFLKNKGEQRFQGDTLTYRSGKNKQS